MKKGLQPFKTTQKKSLGVQTQLSHLMIYLNKYQLRQNKKIRNFFLILLICAESVPMTETTENKFNI